MKLDDNYLARFLLLELLLALGGGGEQVASPPVLPHRGRRGTWGGQLSPVLLVLPRTTWR